MAKIILTTLNARYSHTSLSLRYLYANLHDLRQSAEILEFVIGNNNQEIAQKLLEKNPKIIGFSVYIWNVNDIREIIGILKAVAPHVWIILGGPEVSFLPRRVDLEKADYFISGEGEELFYTLCKGLLNSQVVSQKTFYSKGVDLKKTVLPYEFYSDFDIKNRHIYIESSRGCPFECEFCLSSIDKKVRYFDFELLLGALQTLWQRGVRDFKFIDRTFNLNMKKANALIDFFLEKEEPFFLHFEFIPESFPRQLKERLKAFDKGSLQLEIGIQTLNETVAKKINRPLNIQKIEENLHFLSTQTNAHLHLDLIIGLPGESMESFAKNLDTLMRLSQCEVQLGVLKKLSGTTLERHDGKHKMVYNQNPPYDILQTDAIDFLQMQELKRFARYFDIVYNSGKFKQTCLLWWKEGCVFDPFYRFSKYIYQVTQATHKIALERVAKVLYDFLVTEEGLDKKVVAQTMAADLQKVKMRKLPLFLREFAVAATADESGTKARIRQAHHG